MLNTPTDLTQYTNTAQTELSDEQVDKVIYAIDGAMNAYDPADPESTAPPFTYDCLVKMRAIIRDVLVVALTAQR